MVSGLVPCQPAFCSGTVRQQSEIQLHDVLTYQSQVENDVTQPLGSLLPILHDCPALSPQSAVFLALYRLMDPGVACVGQGAAAVECMIVAHIDNVPSHHSRRCIP